jgi:hypothetical protein
MDDFKKYQAATKLGLTDAMVSQLIELTGVCKKMPHKRCIGNVEDHEDETVEIMEIERPSGFHREGRNDTPAVTKLREEMARARTEIHDLRNKLSGRSSIIHFTGRNL